MVAKAKSGSAGATDRVHGSGNDKTTKTAAAAAVELEDAACLVADYFSDPEEVHFKRRTCPISF